MIFTMIFLTIHKISYYKVRVSTGSVKTRLLGGSFLMVNRNNAGRLGSSFISVCLETRWLGHLGGFYLLERPCSRMIVTSMISNDVADVPRSVSSSGWREDN